MTIQAHISIILKFSLTEVYFFLVQSINLLGNTVRNGL